MPPRKRTSSGCKKSTNQNREQHQQPSQPSKFGIQHFFDRHSQSQRTPLHTKNVFPDSTISANKNPKTEHIVTRNPANDLKDEQARAQDQMGLKNLHNMDPIDEKLKGLTRVDGSITISADDRRPEHILPVVIDEEKNQLEVSPEASKSLCVKRFKFSPVMLIKQSQDDVVDDVTWRISPINERLKKMSKHLLPGTVRVLADSSRFNVMNFQQCSQKKVQISPDMPGKFEKWLSSPPPKTSEKAMISLDRTFLSNVKSEEHDVKFYVNKSITNSNSISEGHNTRSPFSTPPSLSCCPGKMQADSDAGSHGASDQLGTRQHKKALIELLDQVEDVISVEDSSCEDNRIVSDVDRQIKNNLSVNCLTKNSEQHRCSKDSDIKFLVLEVSAESSGPQSTFKVLRLLNEQSGVERAVRLWDDWYDSIVAPGDTVNVIGGFDAEGKCDVNHEQNFLIVHPDIFVAGTRVSGSISCQRRAILDERLKSSEYSSAALNGTLLHQIFEAGLTSEFPTKEFLEQYARIVLQKNLESLYACGENEYDTLKTLIEAVPKILNWIFCFRDSQVSRSPSVDFENEGPKKIKIAEVVDIEEMAWSPKYGLKGNIDASIRVRTNIKSGEANEIIMPLEFKTGKSTSAATVIEHNAQVILYTLLMSERYMMNIERGLLYNLHTDHTKGIFVGRPGLIGVIKRRNELADELLKALTAQQLPPMRQIPNMCKYCRHLNVCTIYHKAYGGTTKGSGLGEVYDSLVSHLTATHVDFLRKWERLVDLEARHTEALKKECWSWENLRNGNHQNFLSSLVLETPDKSSQQGFCTDNRFVYRFVGLELSLLHPEQLSGISLSPSSCFHDIFKSGEYVTLSTEPVHMLIAKGIIVDIGNFHVSISFAKRLRLPWCNTGAMVNHLHQQHWRIDKDEFMSTFATMRYNIIQLFLQNESSSHLRRMIVDLEIPRFESGCIFSQDPAVSYVCSENSLNDDQRRAILKILAAKDYALILGMPGTGKTTTMVHAVKALLMRGSSILLTSYQNTAVDNLLIKLKAQNIDFVRIGRREVVHEEVQENCLSGMKMNSTEDIEKKMNYTNVVAVTCSGITSSLLSKKKFDVCIMDEAGQITLPISLGPLMFASKFVLVGDPYQLPPIVKSQEAKENGMGKSLFSRLSEAHPQAIAALYSQYRMCSAIMELSNALIYGNRLRCGSSEIENAKLKYKYSPTAPAWLMKVLNPNQSVIFINTDLLPAYESKDGTAVNNKIEAFIIAEVTKAMLLGGISEQEIGIITPYNSQVNLIRGSISEPVEVHTIDKYQGRDKDCILVSFVKSSENPRNNAGLLLGDWHRINVAITRAKKKLIMVGSCKTLAKVPLLKLLIEKVDDLSGLLAFNMNEINYRFEMRRCSEI